MNRTLALAALLAALATSRADLVIEQKIEAAGKPAAMSTLKMKGTKLRVDTDTVAGAVSTIVDLETRESLTLLHASKLAMKMTAAETKATLEMLRTRAGAGGNLDTSKTVATGRKEMVGDWNAEVFTSKDGARTIWVTSDLPNFAKVKERLDKLSTPPAPVSKKSAAREPPLPGVIVKTEIAAAEQTFTTTILSVEEEDLEAALFEAPPDYRETTKPAAK